MAMAEAQPPQTSEQPIGRGLFYIFWGILVAAVGGVAWVIFGIIMIVFGFLLIFIPPCVVKD